MERHAAQAPSLRERYPYSTFDVERSMFDVQIVAEFIVKTVNCDPTTVNG
jgi:hypothetical protein